MWWQNSQKSKDFTRLLLSNKLINCHIKKGTPDRKINFDTVQMCVGVLHLINLVMYTYCGYCNVSLKNGQISGLLQVKIIEIQI